MRLSAPDMGVISGLIENGGDQCDGDQVRAFLTSIDGFSVDEAVAAADLLHARSGWSKDTWLTCLEGIDEAQKGTN